MEYSRPELRSLGHLATLTRGANGSSLDGTSRSNQRGGGNDGQADGGPNSKQR